MSWLGRLEQLAGERERAGLRRQVRPRGADDGLVDLAGNDYLGLSRHPDVVAAAAAALKGYGLGATGSRLVRGSTDAHAELEAALADLLGCEAALVYSSGYLANIGAVRALGTAGVLGDGADGVVIASDAHNHASLVDGCRVAGAGPGHRRARVSVYTHADAAALDAAWQGSAGCAVTESVFSVHGDLAPLPALHQVVRRHGGVLLVDDAHALGVLGPCGGGAVAAVGLSGQPDVVVTATLSKAVGAAGGVVAGPRAFIRHLVETSRTFIFDTAPPPAVAAGALAALDLVRGGVGAAARVELAERAAWAVARLREAGCEVTDPAAGVLCVRAPDPAQALAWAAACRDQGVAVGCFRPPSTPDGASRLRVTINAGLARDGFERAVQTIVTTAPAEARGGGQLGTS